jgi:hypothetical protein
MNFNAPPTFWEDRGRLVAADGAVLPQRCVKCNGTHDVVMRRKTFVWKPSAVMLSGVAQRLTPSRSSTLTFGLCQNHRRSHRILIAATLATLALGFGLIGLAAHLGKPMWSLGGLAAIVAAGVVWTFTAVLSPRSGGRDEATVYGGAGRAFVESLSARAGVRDQVPTLSAA